MATTTRIWVATDSGTWGNIEDLRILEIPDDRLNEFADEMTDSDRSDYARHHGKIVP